MDETTIEPTGTVLGQASGRRVVLRSLGVAGTALLAALGVADATAANPHKGKNTNQRKNRRRERHRTPPGPGPAGSSADGATGATGVTGVTGGTTACRASTRGRRRSPARRRCTAT